MDAPDPSPPTAEATAPTPTWTYPTRFCRICREDVPATVTMYPPGLPPSFQRPIVEYRNEDEYGRLIKPCLCRGGMRYIHELCLLRSRTENNRVGSMWKCHECGYKFNFQKLAIQRFLSSKYSSGTLTVLVMLVIMFILGFIADPIINLYADPYDTLLGHDPIWKEVRIQSPVSRGVSRWMQHFMKGLVSMGLVGFLKTLLLNPFQWWNIRNTGLMGSRTTSSTGRDRAVNISWIAVIIGISSAFYFFYQWVRSIIQKSLQRIGNNIVDTQLPGDDDDLKPPPGWKAESKETEVTSEDQPLEQSSGSISSDDQANDVEPWEHIEREQVNDTGSYRQRQRDTKELTGDLPDSSKMLSGSWSGDSALDGGHSSALDSAHKQDWSFQ